MKYVIFSRINGNTTSENTAATISEAWKIYGEIIAQYATSYNVEKVEIIIRDMEEHINNHVTTIYHE